MGEALYPTVGTVTAQNLIKASEYNTVKTAINILRDYVYVGWDDLRVPITSVKLQGTKDPDFAKVFDNGIASQGVFIYLFDDGTEEEVYFTAQIPHEWKLESNLIPHVHWLPQDAGGAGTNVCWGLEYVWIDIAGVATTTPIIYGDVTRLDETLVADKHYITELSEIDGTGQGMSSMLLCRLFRDTAGAGGTDDYVGDAGLMEFDFHIEIDSFGSHEEYTK